MAKAQNQNEEEEEKSPEQLAKEAEDKDRKKRNQNLSRFIYVMVGSTGVVTMAISINALIFMILSLLPAIILTTFSASKGSSFFNTIVCFNISGL
ncbi:MAG: hypothetical protein AAF153_01575, partial [Pseudomonadota bacterium]